MEILKLGQKNFTETIKRVSMSIRQGMVIVLPTDTVYGLVADATNKKAVGKIFKIKERKEGKPIPIFVRDIRMAKKLALIDKKQEKFLKKVWHGKITVVLKKKAKTKLYGADKKTIGLRVPKYKFINALLKKLKRPLTGTSANISGRPAATKIKEVLAQFNDKRHRPDLVLDAGNLKPSKPSTVIDLTGKKPKTLRR